MFVFFLAVRIVISDKCVEIYFFGFTVALLMFPFPLGCQSHAKANFVTWQSNQSWTKQKKTENHFPQARILFGKRLCICVLPFSQSSPCYYSSATMLPNSQPHGFPKTIIPKHTKDKLSPNALDTSQSLPEWTFFLGSLLLIWWCHQPPWVSWVPRLCS